MKYTFIRIPRTASRSIAKTLFGKIEKHKTAKELKNQKGWKFAIVRNPYDRFISAYYQAGWDKDWDINEFVKNHFEMLKDNHIALFRPQWEYLYENDQLLVDYIGRFEELDKSWKDITKMLKINKALLPGHSKIPQEQRTKLNKDSKKILAEYYKKDFQLLGYKT